MQRLTQVVARKNYKVLDRSPEEMAKKMQKPTTSPGLIRFMSDANGSAKPHAPNSSNSAAMSERPCGKDRSVLCSIKLRTKPDPHDRRLS